MEDNNIAARVEDFVCLSSYLVLSECIENGHSGFVHVTDYFKTQYKKFSRLKWISIDSNSLIGTTHSSLTTYVASSNGPKRRKKLLSASKQLSETYSTTGGISLTE